MDTKQIKARRQNSPPSTATPTAQIVAFKKQRQVYEEAKAGLVAQHNTVLGAKDEEIKQLKAQHDTITAINAGVIKGLKEENAHLKQRVETLMEQLPGDE